jgi:pyruvate, water dikinase
VLPIKTQFRHSPTIHLMLEWDGAEAFSVVRSSALLTQVMGRVQPNSARIETYGDDEVRRAEEAVRADPRGAEAGELKRRLIGMMVTRDESILPLVEKYLTLEDVLEVRWRMFGTGLIGGKAVGMLLARKIAERESPGLGAKLEAHDSFYIGSDVFYTFLVRNGLWEIREKQHSPDTFLDGVEEAQERILTGKFSNYEIGLFEKMLDYFGQYPVIVRSSSLLEDAYGNSFAGKYDSVFCANQGGLEERLRFSRRHPQRLRQQHEPGGAVVPRAPRPAEARRADGAAGDAGDGRTAGPRVLSAPRRRGLLLQPVRVGPGDRSEGRGGAPRLWPRYARRGPRRRRLHPRGGPQRPPAPARGQLRRDRPPHPAQGRFRGPRLGGDFRGRFFGPAAAAQGVPVDLFTTETPEGGRFLTFDGLLTRTGFVADFQLLLKTLEGVYGKPVDIEFAVNFLPDGKGYLINLLQCRPLQVQGTHNPEVPQVECPAEGVLLLGKGAVVGHSRVERIDWLVLVVPEVYGPMPSATATGVARAVGAVNRALAAWMSGTLAIGPGRWGTHMASLGVPVRFSEISHMTPICELMMMHEFLTPDVSLGTHFFGELVEMNILYFALFPGREGNRLNLDALMAAPNRLGGAGAGGGRPVRRAARGARGRPEPRRRVAGGRRRGTAGDVSLLPADAARVGRRLSRGATGR